MIKKLLEGKKARDTLIESETDENFFEKWRESVTSAEKSTHMYELNLSFGTEQWESIPNSYFARPPKGYMEKIDAALDEWQDFGVEGWGEDSKYGEHSQDDLEESDSGNTYNDGYLGPTDFNWRVYKSPDGKFFGQINVHHIGDVRGGYGDGHVKEFDNRESAVIGINELFGCNINIQVKFKDGSEIIYSSTQEYDVPRYERISIESSSGDEAQPKLDLKTKEGEEVKVPNEGMAVMFDKELNEMVEQGTNEFDEVIDDMASKLK